MGVNFMEVDLVRTGDWRTLPRSQPGANAAYRYAIRLTSDPGAVHFQPMELRERLPLLPVPLRREDPAIRIDLQELVDRVYQNGRYHRRINYRKPCPASLDQRDLEYTQQLLQGPQEP